MAHRSWRLERNEPFRYSIYHGCGYELYTSLDTVSTGAVGAESTCCSWRRIITLLVLLLSAIAHWLTSR